ncbi:MAG: hypothetical protein GC149_13450 [Gammaproteobacteria bacterium]|nr:hypothetical protein [Gammaproteobacteria bacterium]
MKRILLAALLTSTAVAANAADVGVSISVGQPGFYGQLDIGNYPRPVVVNPQPVIIQRGAMEAQPIYLRVPPGHIKHWSKNCHKYNACNRRVYFVQENWYEHEYVPRYQAEHRRHEKYNKHRKDHRDRGNQRHEYRDHDRGRDD